MIKYEDIIKRIANIEKKKIKIGLIIDEFFGAVGTAYGGYGFLARRHIAKYLPNEDFQVDVLLGRGKRRFFAESYPVDDVNVYRLPRSKWFAKQWLKKQDLESFEMSTILIDEINNKIN